MDLHAPPVHQKFLAHGKDGHSVVRTHVVSDRRKGTLQRHVRDHVAPGSVVHTDELLSYHGLDDEYVHHVINHAETYVRGTVHTNGMENFWSLLKRGIRGTYVSVEPFHLFRYLDEQAFRFSLRKDAGGDRGRFKTLLSHVAGKRLTYRNLIGDGAAWTAGSGSRWSGRQRSATPRLQLLQQQRGEDLG